MRKVLYKKWIPLRHDETTKKRVPDTGCFETEFTIQGLFHCWGNTYEEFDAGPGNITVAIVENIDGTVIEVQTNNLKFIS